MLYSSEIACNSGACGRQFLSPCGKFENGDVEIGTWCMGTYIVPKSPYTTYLLTLSTTG